MVWKVLYGAENVVAQALSASTANFGADISCNDYLYKSRNNQQQLVRTAIYVALDFVRSINFLLV